jgi:hypothetical protein
MANKSNPAAQTISIPEGGGALQGIGKLYLGGETQMAINLESAVPLALQSEWR